MFVDLDGFKAVNDRHGHRVGDEVLIMMTNRMRSVLGPETRVARLGGDEFAVLCHDVADRSAVLAIADSVVDSVRCPIRIGDAVIGLSASVGIAFDVDDTAGADLLLGRADVALYRASGPERDVGRSPTARRAGWSTVPEPSGGGNALSRHPNFFEALVEVDTHATIVVDEDAQILFASVEAETYSGVPSEDVIGMNLFGFVHPDSVDAAISVWEWKTQVWGENEKELLRPFELHLAHTGLDRVIEVALSDLMLEDGSTGHGRAIHGPTRPSRSLGGGVSGVRKPGWGVRVT